MPLNPLIDTNLTMKCLIHQCTLKGEENSIVCTRYMDMGTEANLDLISAN